MEHSDSEQIKLIKEKIDKDKQQTATLKGREEENLKQLSSHGIKSLDDAEKWLIKMDKELNKQEELLQADFESLKKKMIIQIKRAYDVETDSEAEKILLGE